MTLVGEKSFAISKQVSTKPAGTATSPSQSRLNITEMAMKTSMGHLLKDFCSSVVADMFFPFQTVDKSRRALTSWRCKAPVIGAVVETLVCTTTRPDIR
ncbi:hypothetical protein TOC8172_40470 [Pseudomonas syringae]